MTSKWRQTFGSVVEFRERGGRGAGAEGIGGSGAAAEDMRIAHRMTLHRRRRRLCGRRSSPSLRAIAPLWV